MEGIVFVRGNIELKSGDHIVKELIAFADEYEMIAEKIIDGDLIVTENDKLEPYIIYCASKDVIICGDFINCLQSPENVIKIFNEEIANLQRLRREKISSELVSVLNRQIYIGVVGSMELFLCDFLFSMILGSKEYYTRFCEYSSRTFKLKEISSKEWRITDGVMEAIIETNYHRISDIKGTYKKTLQLDFPPTEKLERQILTRHSLVHRNGRPGKNSEYIQVDDKMIDELISEVQALVSHIICMKTIEIREWIPNPSKE